MVKLVEQPAQQDAALLASCSRTLAIQLEDSTGALRPDFRWASSFECFGARGCWTTSGMLLGSLLHALCVLRVSWISDTMNSCGFLFIFWLLHAQVGSINNRICLGTG